MYSEQIPHGNLANGIGHGPYPQAPDELIQLYLRKRTLQPYGDTRTDDQIIDDTESSWQYDQHCAAVEEASQNFRITPSHALYMTDKVLRPWFILRRGRFVIEKSNDD